MEKWRSSPHPHKVLVLPSLVVLRWKEPRSLFPPAGRSVQFFPSRDRQQTEPKPFFLSFLSERSLPSFLEELIAQSSRIAVGSSCCYFPSVLLYACHAFFFFAFLVPALVATTELPVIISIFEGILLLFALLSICLPPCPPSLVLQFCWGVNWRAIRLNCNLVYSESGDSSLLLAAIFPLPLCLVVQCIWKKGVRVCACCNYTLLSCVRQLYSGVWCLDSFC